MNTMLVVDDELAFAEVIAKIAIAAGYEVSIASTAVAFRQACVAADPTVVVLDLQMPDTDGMELLRELADRRCRSKIVLVSGVDLRLLASAERLGVEVGLVMAGVLQKPIRAAEFKKLLSAVGHVKGELTAAALSEALGTERLFLTYQPKVHIATRRLIGVEALVRIRNGTGLAIMPDSFIPVAERTGLIDQLTSQVVEQAFRQAGQWLKAGIVLRLAVNLSAKNIHDRQLPNLLSAQCETAGILPDCVTLELTETATTQDFTTLLEILGRLRLKGFRLSIDDFGTGYSSIAQLLKLPFTELKIDRSFVMGLDRTRDPAIITKTIIDMAHNLGLSTVAEGVETESALIMLAEFGCDEAQGYLFSRPVDAEAIGVLAANPEQM